MVNTSRIGRIAEQKLSQYLDVTTVAILTPEEKRRFVSIGNRPYMMLYRGGSLAQITNDGYVDCYQALSLTTDYRMARNWAFGATDAQYAELTRHMLGVEDRSARALFSFLVPVSEINFGNSQGKMVVRELDYAEPDSEKEYTGYYQIPLQWVGTVRLRKGRLVNASFNPAVEFERRKLNVLPELRILYEERYWKVQ